jgi:hypothetical protein
MKVATRANIFILNSIKGRLLKIQISTKFYPINYNIDPSLHKILKVKNVRVLNDTVFILQRLRFMVFNATFNNISVIWRSVLLVEENGVPSENHLPAASQ